MKKRKMIRKLLKIIAPKVFNDGLSRCNDLGKSLISQKGIEKFLDCGCGDGTLTMEFQKILKAKEIYGIEFIDEFREKAEKKGIKCLKCDLNGKWNFNDNFFDLVLSSQNIEHLHNTRLYLEECNRCLKKGGQLIILTENLASWANIGALFFGWQPFSTTIINGWSLGNPFIWHIDESKDEKFLNEFQDTGISGLVGHVRVLAPRGIKELLERVSFKNIQIYTRGYFPFLGVISDFLCQVDKTHGHFLIVTAFK